MKYLRHSKVGFLIWKSVGGVPRHADMGDFLLKVYGGSLLSAGFVMDIGDGVQCFGDSATLNLAAGPDDTEALRKELSR